MSEAGLAYAAAILLLLAVTAYSTAGGVDFGAGIWALLAGPGERGDRARDLIHHSMAPVWEVNNVWLVLAIVVCWTAFPGLFEAVFLSLYPLFAVALVGLILRGAFFAFGHVAVEDHDRRLADAVFGVSSLLTPFFFAAILGAIASGRVGTAGVLRANVNLMSLAFGLVSVAATALTGAVFLVGDARRDAPELVDYFRARALAATGALVLAGTLGLGAVLVDRPQLLVGMLTTLALPFTLAAMLLTPAVAWLLWRRRFVAYRALVVLAVGALPVAWALAQAPYLLPGRLTVAAAAAPATTLGLLLVVAAGVLLVVGPSIGLLIYLDQKSLLEQPRA